LLLLVCSAHFYLFLQCFHHAAALNVRYVLYVEATVIAVVRVVILVFPQEAIGLYRALLVKLATDHLGWIYKSPRAPIPVFTSEVLGRVVDMHTLTQQLVVWLAAVAHVHATGPLPSVDRIVNGLTSSWNASKGNVDVITKLLMLLHSSSIKHLDMETVLWDMIIKLGIIQAFNVERWAAAGIPAINGAKSFGQLSRLGARHGRTVCGFLSRAMQYFVKHARQDVIPHAQVPVAVNQQVFSLVFFNSIEGRARRGHGDGTHYLSNNKTARVCVVCHGIGDTKRVTTSCATCLDADNGITLCRTARKHTLDNNHNTSCWDLFHSAGFTLLSRSEAVTAATAAAAGGGAGPAAGAGGGGGGGGVGEV
jgi:hypothetical protein